MEHSKLPWIQLNNPHRSDFPIGNPLETPFAFVRKKEDAQFIVTACNEYDTLKAENKQLKIDNKYHIETIRTANEGIERVQAKIGSCVMLNEALMEENPRLKAKAELFDELSRWIYAEDKTDYIKGKTTTELVNLVMNLISKAKELK